MIAVGESSKHIIQIIQLLEERNMSFSFCLNRADTLVLCGMVLLYQTMDLKQDSKLLKDNEKLVNVVIKAVENAKAPGCFDFKRVSGMLVTIDEPTPHSLPTPPRQSPDTCLAAPPTHRTSPATAHKAHPTLGRHLAASMSETDLLLQQEKLRRMTMPHTHQQARADQLPPRSRGSFDSPRPSVPLSQRDHRLSLSQAHAAQAAMLARLSTSPNTNPKQAAMEYLHLDSPSSPLHPRGSPHHSHNHNHHAHPHQSSTHAQQAHLYAHLQKGSSASTAEWEALLGSIDSGQLNVYDAIYGGPGLALAEQTQTQTHTQTTPTVSSQQQQQQQQQHAAQQQAAWSPDSWDLTGFNLGDFGSGTGSGQSVVSLSEDGLSSGDDLISVGSGMDFGRRGMMPVATAEGYVLEGLEAGFGM